MFIFFILVQLLPQFYPSVVHGFHSIRHWRVIFRKKDRAKVLQNANIVKTDNMTAWFELLESVGPIGNLSMLGEKERKLLMKLNFSKLLVKTQNIKVLKEIEDQGKLQTRYKNAENVFGKKLKQNRNIFLKNAELKNGNAKKTLKKNGTKECEFFKMFVTH